MQLFGYQLQSFPYPIEITWTWDLKGFGFIDYVAEMIGVRDDINICSMLDCVAKLVSECLLRCIAIHGSDDPCGYTHIYLLGQALYLF